VNRLEQHKNNQKGLAPLTIPCSTLTNSMQLHQKKSLRRTMLSTLYTKHTTFFYPKDKHILISCPRQKSHKQEKYIYTWCSSPYLELLRSENSRRPLLALPFFLRSFFMLRKIPKHVPFSPSPFPIV